jgi:hypothetical protein
MSHSVCLLAVLAAVPAYAERVNHVTFEAFAAGGGNTTTNHELAPDGPEIGVDLRVTIGPVVFGALGDTTLAVAPWNILGGSTESHVAVLAGAELARWPVQANTAHLQVLGELGEHQFNDLGKGFLDNPVGNNSAELPYVGLRAGGYVATKRGLFAGVWASARSDLGTTSIDVTVYGFCVFSCTPTTEHFDLGGTELNVVLVAGVQL